MRAANKHGLVKQEETPVPRDQLEQHFHIMTYDLTAFVTAFDARALALNNFGVMNLAYQRRIPYLDHFLGAYQAVNEMKVASTFRCESLRRILELKNSKTEALQALWHATEAVD